MRTLRLLEAFQEKSRAWSIPITLRHTGSKKLVLPTLWINLEWYLCHDQFIILITFEIEGGFVIKSTRNDVYHRPHMVWFGMAVSSGTYIYIYIYMGIHGLNVTGDPIWWPWMPPSAPIQGHQIGSPLTHFDSVLQQMLFLKQSSPFPRHGTGTESALACAILQWLGLVPWPRLEPSPQRWECRMLATSPPGNPRISCSVNYVKSNLKPCNSHTIHLCENTIMFMHERHINTEIQAEWLSSMFVLKSCLFMQEHSERN